MLRHWDRPHQRSYHWFLDLSQHQPVIELSQRCQRLLPQAGLDLIPPEGLHLTLCRLGYVDDTPLPRLHTAVRAVRDRCRSIGPFRLTAIPLAGSPGAIRLSVAPWSPLAALHTVTLAASENTNTDSLAVFRPHVGIAYSHRVQPADPYIEAARHARSLSPVVIEVQELHLVELYRVDHQYRWRVLERLPLAAHPSSFP
ncbi:2'-5' RNA ligase family protein [Streptoalloteichus tenebrarius]